MSTIVYKYGLLPPTQNAQLVSDQIYLAHQYHNKLVELARDWYDARDVLLYKGDVAKLRKKIEKVTAKLVESRKEIKIDRVIAKSKKTENVQLNRTIKQLGKELSMLYKLQKRALAKRRKAIAPKLDKLKEKHKLSVHEARSVCGVYWGTYLVVEDAVESALSSKALPKFKHWSGSGTVAVQLQKGMDTAAAFTLEDKRFKIDLTPSPVPQRSGKALPRVLLRVGSTGRDPIWAEWPLIYHRPLPPSRIKWAKVVRRRVATKDQWDLQVVLEEVEPIEKAGRGAVAVKLRWKRLEDGAALLVGDWCDSRKNKDELILHSSIAEGLARTDTLQHIRDSHLNTLKDIIIPWSKKKSGTSKWKKHTNRMQTISRWKSPARFASLSLWWRENHIKGDEEIFAALDAWRKKDKHLYEYQANARQNILARRRDYYKKLSAIFARNNHTLVIEKLDLTDLASTDKKAPEKGEKSSAVGRSQRVVAAPGELRQILINAFTRRGGIIWEVPPQGSANKLLKCYREGLGSEKVRATARSTRFNNRMQGKSLKTRRKK